MARSYTVTISYHSKSKFDSHQTWPKSKVHTILSAGSVMRDSPTLSAQKTPPRYALYNLFKIDGLQLHQQSCQRLNSSIYFFGGSGPDSQQQHLRTPKLFNTKFPSCRRAAPAERSRSQTGCWEGVEPTVKYYCDGYTTGSSFGQLSWSPPPISSRMNSGPVHGIESSRNVSKFLEEHQVGRAIAVPGPSTSLKLLKDI